MWQKVFFFLYKFNLHNGERLCSLQADAGVLQFQNQQLVQQIDIQKHALHDLEVKVRDLKERQNSYDELLIAVNQLWIQVIIYHHGPLSAPCSLFMVVCQFSFIFYFLFVKATLL